MSDYDPGLDAIMRTDRFVDALASGARMSSVDPLSAMLGDWRDDVRRRPDAPVVTMAQASVALARVQKPPRRNRFALTVIGGVAAAVLCLGGFGAVVLDAKPGDALYGLRSTLFGERTQTRNEAVTLAAQELDQVQQLVNQGNWDEAQQKLVTLGPTVQSVSDAQSKQQLVEQYNSLTAKVIQRDPEATPPPPGVPPPVNPSSPLTFLQVPVVVATTTTTPSIPDLATTSGPTTSLPSDRDHVVAVTYHVVAVPDPDHGVADAGVDHGVAELHHDVADLDVAVPDRDHDVADAVPRSLPSSTRATPSRTSYDRAADDLRTTCPRAAALPVTVTTPPPANRRWPRRRRQPGSPRRPRHPGWRPLPEIPRGPQRPPVVITTPTQAPGGPGPR